jgi:serine/threonine protein kinase
MTSIGGDVASALAGRYRIERELGRGGMATVYLAADLKHDRKVAIKVLKPELAAVLGAERFVVEIKTTAALQHPHILPLFDSGEAEGLPLRVMAAEVGGGATLSSQTAHELFTATFASSTPLRAFDVTKDGTRFLVAIGGDVHAPAGEPRMIVNWFSDLRRLSVRRGGRPSP